MILSLFADMATGQTPGTDNPWPAAFLVLFGGLGAVAVVALVDALASAWRGRGSRPLPEDHPGYDVPSFVQPAAEARRAS